MGYFIVSMFFSKLLSYLILSYKIRVSAKGTQGALAMVSETFYGFERDVY